MPYPLLYHMEHATQHGAWSVHAWIRCISHSSHVHPMFIPCLLTRIYIKLMLTWKGKLVDTACQEGSVRILSNLRVLWPLPGRFAFAISFWFEFSYQVKYTYIYFAKTHSLTMTPSGRPLAPLSVRLQCADGEIVVATRMLQNGDIVMYFITLELTPHLLIERRKSITNPIP